MKHSIMVLMLMFGGATLAAAQDQTKPLSAVPQLVASLDPSPAGTPTPRAAAATQQPDSASAERKGFIIGLGGGVAFKRESGIDFRNGTFQVVDSNKTGALTDFRIGYAPSDQVLVYYTNQVAWGENAGFDAIGMSAAGVTYMLKPSTRTAFVTGGIGGSVARNIGSSSGSSDVGLGFSLGGGYEFARHFSVGGRWMSLDVGQAKRSKVFGVTFDWLFY